MAEKSDPVDVAQLAKKDLTETAFPGGGKQDFRIFIDAKIYERIAAHAAEKLATEICGVLVGKWHRDADGPFVLVNESIRCDKATSNAGDVTFTHEAWNTEIYPRMDKEFTDREIVGWYHSHPNYGIFLSDRDSFIQEHYFNGPGHIALVVDPVNKIEGVFASREGKPKLWPHFWVGDKIHLCSEGKDRPASSAPPAGESTGAAATPPAPPRSSRMTWVLGVICCLLVGFLLGGWVTGPDRTRGEFFVGICKGLQLRRDIVNVQKKILVTANEMEVVAAENKAIAVMVTELKKRQWQQSHGPKEPEPDPADVAAKKDKQWQQIVGLLQDTLGDLNAIRDNYGMTQEQIVDMAGLLKQLEEAENLAKGGAKDSGDHDSGQSTATATTTAANPPAAKPSKTSTTAGPATSAIAPVVSKTSTSPVPAMSTTASAPAPNSAALAPAKNTVAPVPATPVPTTLAPVKPADTAKPAGVEKKP